MTTPRGPLATVRIYHDEIFSLVVDEAATPVEGQVTVGDETFFALGEYAVIGKGGEPEVRTKIQQFVSGGFTEVAVSPDVVGSPTEFTHMAEFLLDRHAPGEHVTGLQLVDGDEAVAKRLAAVMGVEYMSQGA